jgi:hypothetical protein
LQKSSSRKTVIVRWSNSEFHRLQDVSSEAEETSKASGGADNGAVGGALERSGGCLRSLGANWDDWDNGGANRGGGVDVGGGSWLGAVSGGELAVCSSSLTPRSLDLDSSIGDLPGVADDNWGHGDWLGDGARAVGDGEGGGLSDGVGLVVVGQGGGSRAVGGVSSDDLGNVGDVAVGSDGGHEGSGDGGGGELHLDDWDDFTLKK